MSFHTDAVELVKKMTLDEKLSQLRYDSPAIERLKIPAYNWWNEGLHGVARSGTATVFPQAIGMAASFNPDLLNCVATAISDEARAKYNGYKLFGSTGIYQGLTYWSPNINIFRDPRWGRGHETYGEDPYLTGRMGCAFIEGLQGDDPTWRKLDATIKHFAVHSGPESTRHEADVEIDRETMDDTYLWAFRYCIEHADPSAVMGAYNRVNGEPCCASETLLQKILREEWDYRGYVVSDCGAIHDINAHHHVTFTDAESAAAMYAATGCDLVMVGRAALGRPWVFRQIERYLADGTLLPDPPLEERMAVLLRHAELAIRYKGEGIAMREIRRHAFAYMKGVRGGADFRRRAGLVSSLEELRTLADELINSTENS